MKNLAEKFLSAAEQERIREAVRDAEGRTAGEIVCMIVSASYSYPMADVIGATALALPLSAAAAPLIGARLWLGTHDMWLFMGLFALFFILAYRVVVHLPGLKRLFVSGREIDEEVEEAAVTHFFRHRLYRTRQGTGVLIFISVFERRVWVLADSAINARVPQGQWDDIVGMITEGIRRKQAAAAVCRAVHAVGSRLEEHFPKPPDDTDELDNLIISAD